MKLIFKFLSLAALTILPVSVVVAQRGIDSELRAGSIIAAGKQWAVFIAIDKYEDKAWGRPLEYPVNDAREIKETLLKYYYIDEVRELINEKATAAAIRILFANLAKEVEDNDSVFVFHAGHGLKDENTNTSALIAYDGVRNTYDQKGWLSHDQIRKLLDSLKAKHVFLISDSCFSGDLLTRGDDDPAITDDIPAAYHYQSRQVMSSGASENVDDRSEFASRLRDTLIRTDAPFITPEYLYYQIKYVPTTKELTTYPNLAAIPNSRHVVGGNFLFFRKNPRPGAALIYPVAQPPKASTSVVKKDPPPPVVKAKTGEEDYFIGSWIADIEYNGSIDTYEINLSINGRRKVANVKVTNDTAQQETTGNWSWDGSMFKLEATFRNPSIAYLRNIKWVSLVRFDDGNNTFRILGKAATNGPQVGITFWIAGEKSGTDVTNTIKTYKIGDIGPAGGIVFYDRGFIADGWRYLEAAPVETEFSTIWGAYEKNVPGTDMSLGSGKRNTQIIVEYLSRNGERNRAAQTCTAMDVNGFNDWFLPSKDELDLMYKNMKQKGLGGFSSNNWYWSSSQYNSSYAWFQDFGNGRTYYTFIEGTNKGNMKLSVRAVRAF